MSNRFVLRVTAPRAATQSLFRRNLRKVYLHPGFTLIELLVVIAIIAILASILFPVFGRARENARRSSCMSNVKQIGLGVLQYTQDFDETYPAADLPNGGSGATHWYWGQMIQPYTKSTQVLQCPSDTDTTTKPDGSWISPTGIELGFPAPAHTSYIYNYNFRGTKLAAVTVPTTTVLITDGAFRSQGTAPWVTTTTKPAAYVLADASHSQASGGNAGWGGPNDRHLETTVVLFADGHVKSLKLTSFYSGATTPYLDPTVGG